MKVTVCDLINNKHTQFIEDDREWLSALHENQLEAMVPVNIPEVKANEEKKVEPVTFEQLLANAPADVKAQHEFVKRQMQQNRDGWIGRIKANKTNKFTDEQLGAMDDTMLRTVADTFAPIANYAGAEGSETVTTNTEEIELLPTINEQLKEQDKK